VKLNLFAEPTVFIEAKFTFSFCIHVNFVPVRNVILIFTDGTD
jgi:hypothetical protein